MYLLRVSFRKRRKEKGCLYKVCVLSLCRRQHLRIISLGGSGKGSCSGPGGRGGNEQSPVGGGGKNSPETTESKD